MTDYTPEGLTLRQLKPVLNALTDARDRWYDTAIALYGENDHRGGATAAGKGKAVAEAMQAVIDACTGGA